MCLYDSITYYVHQKQYIFSENTSDAIDQSRSHCDEEVELQVAIDASLKEAKDTPR